MPEIGIYVPQVGFSFDEMLSRAERCEQLGFGSFWLFDHLYAPGLPDHRALEGWTLATALLTRTSTIHIGHLVLDNNLRHPALLGRMVATLDHIAGQRFELGIGSGSYEAEHHEGGLPWGSARQRSERLAEALAILEGMFAGTPTTFEGEHYAVRGLPNRGGRRPVVHIGGGGERYTLPIVARHADVWNVPTYALAGIAAKDEVLSRECEKIGRDPATIRRSVEAVLVLAPDQRTLDEARSRAEGRYAGPAWGLHDGGFIGTPQAIVDRIGELAAAGVDLFVFLPADRGAGDGLELLAREVMACI